MLLVRDFFARRHAKWHKRQNAECFPPTRYTFQAGAAAAPRQPAVPGTATCIGQQAPPLGTQTAVVVSGPPGTATCIGQPQQQQLGTQTAFSGGMLGGTATCIGGGGVPTTRELSCPVKSQNPSSHFQQALLPASADNQLHSGLQRPSSTSRHLCKGLQHASDNRNNNNLGHERPSAVECPVERGHALAAHLQLVSHFVP